MAVQSTQPRLSPWWRHSIILVMIAGFSLLIAVTVLTYTNAPPIPDSVVDQSGKVLFTKAQLLHGESVFFKYDLMDYGTLWGHGAYLGPDFSAAYLHDEALIYQEALAQRDYGKPYANLNPLERSAVDGTLKISIKQNRYDPTLHQLTFTEPEITAYQFELLKWRRFFDGSQPAPGLAPKYIPGNRDMQDLVSYFAWAAWATVANRPGEDYSYTNNWPYEPLVGNTPNVSTYLWSALSLITLLVGLGGVLFMVGKFDYLGWKGDHSTLIHPESVQPWKLTPSQRATGKYFLIVAALFLVQVFLGGALAHFRVESGSFYGFDLAKLLPWTILRTWHLQMAIFWIATAWVAGGLFLSARVGGGDPPKQKLGVNLLFVALLIVVAGSFLGEYLGINNRLGHLWFWLGDQGSEYLELGRLWQILLAVGLVGWIFLMFRALRPAMKSPEKSELASLFLYAAIAIPIFYLPAMFYGPHTNYAVIDNWRFWIIHLWVEGFFELFATVLVAIIFNQLGLISTLTATRVVYLDAILYLGAGIVGTGHHWYFTGQSTFNMGLAACFSAMEIVPLTLLTLDAWDFIRLSRDDNFKFINPVAASQKWAIYFLMAVGFWNFVGAGIFGFLINLPIISYFEIGTNLTPNHGHAALFGVFGELAIAVMVFCMRAMQSDKAWERSQKYVRLGFWGSNIGLILMVLLDLFPAGVLQLKASMTHGYWYARQITYLMSGTFHSLEWLRIIGDLTFILAGALPIFIAVALAYIHRDVPAEEQVSPAD